MKTIVALLREVGHIIELFTVCQFSYKNNFLETNNITQVIKALTNNPDHISFIPKTNNLGQANCSSPLIQIGMVKMEVLSIISIRIANE